VTDVVDGLSPQVVLPSLKLVTTSGPDQGAAVTAKRGILRVGTAPDNDLVLHDRSVSRHHLRIELRSDRVIIEDLDSSNGTRIDGVSILKAPLAPGASIQIGQTSLVVTAIEEPLVLQLSQRTRFGGLIGASVEMRRTFALLERVAPTNTTVLIEGETGTGKEVAAEAIHSESNREGAPFVTFDCGAVSPNLIESALFGHLRGSFTGATADRRGAFEEAEGGTLFLDEIGELPLDLQPKLLRVLESRKVTRIGETRARPLDVRIVAATNRRLEAEVNARRFREDLYFRLAVVHIVLPPLRNRPDDIPLLIDHFVEMLRPGSGGGTAELCKALAGRSYPGNVRELRNTIERALVMNDAARTPDAAGEALPSPAPSLGELPRILSLPLKEAQDQWNEHFTRAYLEHALSKSGGSITLAAQLTGTNRRYIQRLMRRYNIRSGDLGGDDPP
jgi:transcriptional regulator with GAF, ATPase, and Fis domain